MPRKMTLLLWSSVLLLATISILSEGSYKTSAASPSLPIPVAQSSSAKPIQHVFIVSVDGMKPESYTEPDAHGLKVPTLREMVRNGASSDGVQSVMPTVTYPSHTSMVTGMNPRAHGIFTNPAWDPLNQNYGGYRLHEEDIRVSTLSQ